MGMRYNYYFDPGKTTGVAMFRDYSRTPYNVFESNREMLEDYLLTLNESNTALIVYESFTSRSSQHTRQNDALEIIGILKFVARKCGVDIVSQSPSAAKSYCNNHDLRRAGWFGNTHLTTHELDALKHAYLYFKM